MARAALLVLVATHAAAFAPPRPTRAPLVARSYKKRPDAPSPDGLSSLRSAAASGRWREALVLIAAAEEAIGDRAAKGEGQAFPLPIEAYNLAITACGAAGEWREALGVLRRLTVGVDFDGEKGSVLGRRPRPDHVTFNAAGAAAAKSGRWRDAEMVLDQSRRYKRSHIILYTSVIGACGRAREKGRALSHLARLREERGRADVFAFTAAVDACARAGDFSNATALRRAMEAEDRVAPNLRTFRALVSAAGNAGEWAAAEALLDEVRAAFAARDGDDKGWRLRDYAACHEAALFACQDRGDYARAAAVLGRVEADVDARAVGGRDGDALDFTLRGHVAAVGACAAFRGPAEGEDWADRRRVAFELLRRLEDRVSAPARRSMLWRRARERRAAHNAALAVCGRGGFVGDALELLENATTKGLKPDAASFNACLAACRRSEPPKAEASLRIWRQLIDDGTAARPDGVSAAETVACLERGNRTADADEVFGDCLRLGVLLTKPVGPRSAAPPSGVKSSSFLDEDGEYDVSGMTVPLARCAVRRAVYEAAADLDPKATAKASVVFITGVGARRQFDPNHVPLRTHVLQLLRHGFDPPLVAFVPDDAPGTVKVETRSLLAWAAARDEDAADAADKRPARGGGAKRRGKRGRKKGRPSSK